MKKVALVAVLAISGGVVSADPAQLTPGQQSFLQRSTSWESLKAECNPTTQNLQQQPEGIQLDCTETQYDWKKGESETRKGKLDRSRSVSVNVESTKGKFETVAKGYGVDATETVLLCDQYQQVKNTKKFTLRVSCDQIRAYGGSAQDYCSDQASGKSVTETEEVRDARQELVTKNVCVTTDNTSQVKPGEGYPEQQQAPVETKKGKKSRF